MPQLANFLFATVKAVFSEHGIHILAEYPDGQVMWGNEPIVSPYTGAFHIADYFTPGRYDIFTVRAILSRLDKAGEAPAIETRLFESINEEFVDDKEEE